MGSDELEFIKDQCTTYEAAVKQLEASNTSIRFDPPSHFAAIDLAGCHVAGLTAHSIRSLKGCLPVSQAASKRAH